MEKLTGATATLGLSNTSALSIALNDAGDTVYYQFSGDTKVSEAELEFIEDTDNVTGYADSADTMFQPAFRTESGAVYFIGQFILDSLRIGMIRKTNKTTVRFGEWDCSVKYGCYQNGRTSIQLLDLYDGEPVATASVNIPEYDLKDGEVIIKNWSENEGILEALIGAGVVSEPIGSVRTGFVTAQVCKLLGRT